jgi:predicted carbohydrate-binding protein with CBM5 and CBM33 domain
LPLEIQKFGIPLTKSEGEQLYAYWQRHDDSNDFYARSPRDSQGYGIHLGTATQIG